LFTNAIEACTALTEREREKERKRERERERERASLNRMYYLIRVDVAAEGRGWLMASMRVKALRHTSTNLLQTTTRSILQRFKLFKND
jgi:hypothetical protein